MISKISFSKLVRDEMHKLSWLFAVQVLIFGMLIPFRLLIVLAVRGPVFEGMRDVFHNNIALSCPENLGFILVMGIVCALSAFSYVHSAQRLDFFHSLPIKRERLFAAKYLGSVLTFVVAYALCQIAVLLIGAFYGVCSARAVFETAVASLEGVLCFLCSYAGALFAVMLTGKMLATVLMIGVMGLYFPLVWLLQLGVQQIFYHTALTDAGTFMSGDIMTFTSPWAFAIFHNTWGAQRNAGLTGQIPSLAVLCQMVAVAAVFSLLALLLYRVRRTEAAGNALAFLRTEGVLKVLVMIPTAVFAALLACISFYSVAWELFFLVFFGALGCMIIEFIYRGDIRQILHHKAHIAVTVVVSAAIFFACRYDVTGFNTYLPKQEEVESMAVYNYNMTGVETMGFRSEKVLDCLEIEDFAPIYEMARVGAESVEQLGWSDEAVLVMVKYHLKNGKSVYRKYWIPVEFYEEKMNELQEDEQFRETYYPILSWENTDHLIDMSFDVNTQDAWEKLGLEEAAKNVLSKTEQATPYEWETSTDKKSMALDISGKDMDRVLRAYQKDLSQLSFSDLMTHEAGLNMHGVDESNMYYYVTPKCENTLEVIRELYEEEGAE